MNCRRVKRNVTGTLGLFVKGARALAVSGLELYRMCTVTEESCWKKPRRQLSTYSSVSVVVLLCVLLQYRPRLLPPFAARPARRFCKAMNNDLRCGKKTHLIVVTFLPSTMRVEEDVLRMRGVSPGPAEENLNVVCVPLQSAYLFSE